MRIILKCKHYHEEFFSGKVVNTAEDAQLVTDMLGHGRHQCPYCHGTAAYESSDYFLEES
jgi:hypothetical protein